MSMIRISDSILRLADELIYKPVIDKLLAIRIIDRIVRPGGHPRVAAAYADLEQCLAAIKKLKDAGFSRLIVHSPIPSHEIEEAMGKGPSFVRWFTFFGAVLGGTGGFLLAALTSTEWNLVVSGKPIISVPPYLIITFECTILLGALSTLLGFFVMSRLPQPHFDEAYKENFGDDRFGIGVVCPEADAERAKAALNETGALEVYGA